MRRLATSTWALVALAVFFTPLPAIAICDVIPGAVQAKRSTLGSVDRPYAAPDDYVQITLAPLFCTRVESFPLDPQTVTLVFDPPNGPNNAVVIADDCVALATQLGTCDTELGVGGTVTCVDADDPGDPAAPHLVQSADGLSFRFPDTDVRVDAADDDRTLSGPTRIAVVPAGASLQCGQLASSGCSDTTGMTACIDKLYEQDGTCQTDSLEPAFPAFTALPPWNDYSDMCETGIPACSGNDPEVRFTIDEAGNALIPVDWRGVLVRVDDTPFPRLVDGDTTFPAFDGSPDPVRVPPSMIASFAPNGIPVPPLFTPLSEDEDAPLDPLELFGTVDAPLGVMRVSRRSTSFLECSGGDVAGSPCNEASDCPGGTCGATTCRGGGNNGLACSSDAQCPGGECGPALFAFEDRFSGEGCGPILIADAQYGAFAGTTVQIDALIDTDDTLAFPVRESIENQDLNADSDEFDTVIFLGDAREGVAASGESAVAVLRQAPFRFAALAAEGDVVAYPEPEAKEGECDAGLGTCDQNSDGDIGDTLLRVLRVTGNSAAPVSAGLGDVCVDPSPIVAGQSVTVSDGLVFVRADEPACADQELTNLGPFSPGDTVLDSALSRDGDVVAHRQQDVLFDSDALAGLRQAGVSERLDSIDGDPDPFGYSFDLRIDSSGDRVVFQTDVDLTFEAVDPWSVYAYDRFSDSVTLVSRDTDDTPISGTAPLMSRNGRFVVFKSTVGGERLLMRDLQEGTTTVVMTDTDPFFVAECGGASHCNLDEGQPSDDGTVVLWSARIGEGEIFPSDGYLTDLTAGTHENLGITSTGRVARLSADGRFIAFDTIAALVAGDTNSAQDVHVRDRETGVVERVSVGSNGEQAASFSSLRGFSADGRRVLFETAASNLVPNDSGGLTDLMLHDRLTGITERVTLTNADVQFGVSVSTGLGASLSPEGRAASFQFTAVSVQIRTFDPDDTGFDVNSDGDARDVVLAVVDSALVDPGLQGLGASGQADVAGGNAAFLLGGDADPDGGTVNLYRNRSGTSDLGRYASRVELSEEWVGALVSEAVEGNQNAASGDADDEDRVVQVNDVAGGNAGSWVNVGQAADALDVAGPIAVFTTPEADQNGAVLNGDGLADDRVIQLYDAEAGIPSGLANLGYAVEDFVLGDFRRVCTENMGGVCSVDADCPDNALCHNDGSCRALSTLCTSDVDCSGSETCESDLIVAFRASEGGQGANLNGAAQNPDDPPAEVDVDQDDDVLFAYDLLLDKVVNSGQAVTPCLLQACDPRVPYRVVGETVRFLTFEGDQGVGPGPGEGQDLNNNGAREDLLVQILSVRTRKLRIVGALAVDINTPLGEDETPVDPLTPLQDPGPGQGTNEAFVGRGQCVDSLAGGLQGTCVTDADCPGDATCEPTVITVASADEDDDAIPDALDNCLGLYNPGQADADEDGQGDLCDLQTCGNGVREFDENCDDGNLIDGDGCSAFCSAPEPPIELDLMPGVHPNVINIKKNGVIQVVVLGSEEIDVTLIDPDTLAFGPAGALPNDPGDPHIGHYNGNDGFKDAKIHFRAQETGFELGDTEACLEGELDGIFFDACAPVVVINGGGGACGLGAELVLLLPLLVGLRRRKAGRLVNAE